MPNGELWHQVPSERCIYCHFRQFYFCTPLEPVPYSALLFSPFSSHKTHLTLDGRSLPREQLGKMQASSYFREWINLGVAPSPVVLHLNHEVRLSSDKHPPHCG